MCPKVVLMDNIKIVGSPMNIKDVFEFCVMTSVEGVRVWTDFVREPDIVKRHRITFTDEKTNDIHYIGYLRGE